MGPFETASERLLERGYSVIPIIPGTKKPGFFQHGIWVGLEEWTKRFNGRGSLNQRAQALGAQRDRPWCSGRTGQRRPGRRSTSTPRIRRSSPPC